MKIKKGVIDEIGKKEALIKELKGDVDKLKAEVKEVLDLGDSVADKEYCAQISERISTEYAPDKVKKLIKDEKKFLEVIKITNTKLSKYLSKEQMDKCVKETKTTSTLSVKKIKGAKSETKTKNSRNIILD